MLGAELQAPDLPAGEYTLRISAAGREFALDASVRSVAVTADSRVVVGGDTAGGVRFLNLDLPC